MTTENRRRCSRSSAVLAAFGLALVLLPSAAGAVSVTVTSASTAPYATDVVVSSLPVLYMDLNVTGGPAVFTGFNLSMIGDVPASAVSAALWRDADANNQFDPAVDAMISSAPFVPGTVATPPFASLMTGFSDPNGTARFWVTVQFNGIPASRKVSFAFRQPGDFGVPGSNASFPIASNPVLTRLPVYANPVAGVYASPVGGATRAGGQETGLFIHAGQRLHVETVASDTWNLPTTSDANGSGAPGALAGAPLGALVGRIGSAPWFLLGQTSTVTVASSGQLFLAPDDNDWSDNFGSIRAQIEVLPSTTTRVWVGGTLGFETSADIDQNWIGGRPYAGEHAAFYASSYDCDWNIPNAALADLFVSTAFTRSIRLASPQFGGGNRLTTLGDATIQGGSFTIGVATVGPVNELSVQGRLVVSDSATFNLGGSLVVGLGAEFNRSSFLRGTVGANVNAGLPNRPYYWRVYGATVAMTGMTSFSGIDWFELSTATILAADRISFSNYNNGSTSALVNLYSAAPVNFTFNDWSSVPPARAVGVAALGLNPGSTVTFNNSANLTGSSFGSPKTQAAPGVVRWIPDGGGTLGTISGTLNATRTTSVTYRVTASTSPKGGNTILGGSQSVLVSGGSSPYSITGLRAPSTYYVFAYEDAGNGEPGMLGDRGGALHAGYYASEPVWVASGGTTPGVAVALKGWGAVAGSVANLSQQLGTVRVETWDGLPQVAGSTRVAQTIATPSFFLETRSSSPLSAVNNSSYTFAYVDLNGNGVWDNFESSQTVTGYSVNAGATVPVGGVTITGANNIPAGALVLLSSASANFAGVGRFGPQPMIKLRMTAAGGSSSLGAVRLRYLGTPTPNNTTLALWLDDGDQAFNPALDKPLGSGVVTLGQPSTTTIVFAQPAVLPAATAKTFFVTMDLAGAPVGTAGVMIDAATSFALTAGTFTVTPQFPTSTGLLPVFSVVRASEAATPGLTGGAGTNFFVYAGQTLLLTATGQWNTGPGDPVTTPNGLPGTTGLDTLLPSANRGELIGRVQSAAVNSTPWFRVGASTSIAAPGNGELYFAMNDFVNSHYDNGGFVLAGFSVTGSTLGAIAGTVYYSTPTPASLLTVQARLNSSLVVGQSTYAVTASTYYPFLIPGLVPGSYDLVASVDAPPDFGNSFASVQLLANTTSRLDVTMFPSTGAVTGFLSYSGLLPYGLYHVGVATVTDFTGQVTFFGETSQPNPSVFSISNLPTPATYYVVAFRDGNGNSRPDGPEPFGYVGTPGGGLATLPSFLSPVFVPTGGSTSAGTVILNDLGELEGNAQLINGTTGALVVEAGIGVPGVLGYNVENRVTVPLPPAGSQGGQNFRLGLLRPATGYSLFAFVDQNGDGQPSGGEPQAALTAAVTVPIGGRAHADISLATVGPPPPPAVFLSTPLAVSTVTFSWNLVPGATAYQLRRSDTSVFVSLGASASVYLDVLADNTSSQILSITASNGNGVSSPRSLSAPVYSRATVPSAPAISSVTAFGALVNWASTNRPGTVFEVLRATAAFPSPFTRVALGPATFYANTLPLAPASTYHWRVTAIDGNGQPTFASSVSSAVTPTVAGPAIAGVVTYAGGQAAALGRGLVVQIATGPTFAFPFVSSAALPGAPQQPWYLPAGTPATYYPRAFVDVAGNGVLQPGADRFVSGGVAVAGSSVSGVNFTIAADTVPPGAPAGLVAVPGFKKVTVTWVAPTKSADNGPLPDLGAFDVERASSPSASFASLTPLKLSSSTLAFVDNAPVPGVVDIYRVKAIDFGGNVSQPSGAVGATPSSGGSIAGQLRVFTATGNGQYRVRLSTLPAASAVSVAEATLTTYTFTGLSDGVYYLRAFRDVDGDGLQDPVNEPAGTYGGLNSPFPIAIVNGNAVTGADAVICDRGGLPVGLSVGSLTGASCPALDKGPGFYTQLFALRVGGGQGGSFGVGTQINVSVSTDTTFATDLIALGPNGAVAGRDNRVGGANLTLTLSQPGVYLFEPTTFRLGDYGSFGLKLRLEGGFAGVIAGSVTYAGGQGGLVVTQLFLSGQPTQPILTSTAATPGTFTFPGLLDGTYLIRSYRDTNGNGVRDASEPRGQFGASESTPTVVAVTGGAALGGPFNIPIKDPAVGAINGAALYEGTASSPVRIQVSRFTDASKVAFTTVAVNTNYLVPFLAPATDYQVVALLDLNGNGVQDPLEPSISSYPVTVTANSTTTVSVVVRDSGVGQTGNAVVGGTVTYSGASTGPVIVGISRDPYFQTVDYLLTLPGTGYFQRSGLLGNTSYYLAGFIDTNRNGNPDSAQGEVSGPGTYLLDFTTPTFGNAPPVYVAADAFTGVKLDLFDPPNGSAQGVITYSGTSAAPTIIVQAYQYAAPPGTNQPRQTIARVPGVSTYAYHLDYLSAGQFDISAFADANGNGRFDDGEPSGGRGGVSVSTGAGSAPLYGLDMEVFEPGTLGASQAAGSIHGDLTYLGTQGGPLYVRFFGNDSYKGSPLYTLRVPATGLPPAGSGEFNFTRSNLPFGDYWIDAFRDPSDTGVYNPATHAHGYFNGASAVSVSQQRSSAGGGSATVSDPGQGGSVNQYTGSFAAPSGVRFDGGATDLGALIAIDPYATSHGGAPHVVVLGITAQNEGVVSRATRFDNTGSVISSRQMSATGDIQINGMAIDDLDQVYMPGRDEDPDTHNSTGTITVYDENFNFVDFQDYPGYQSLDGISYSTTTTKLFAAGRYQNPAIPNDHGVRAPRIDPVTLLADATGVFNAPGGCAYCGARVMAGAVSPDGSRYVVYAIVNQQNDDDRGIHYLLAFNALSTMQLDATRDITLLDGPSHNGAAMAVTDAGEVFLSFPTGGDTARTYKFGISGSQIQQLASASYGPVKVHFGGGLQNLGFDAGSRSLFEVWESTTGAGDYMLLRYDANLNLVRQRFYDGFDNAHEDTGFSVGVYDSSSVFVSGSVNNGVSLDWGVERFNGNQSGAASAPGTPVAITTANATSFIFGTATYGGTLVTSGTVRVSLTPVYSDVPIRFATAPFSASSDFLFNNVPSGTYDVRAFIDLGPNANQTPDEGEPVGASTLYGIEFAADDSQFLADPIQLCDRRQIAIGGSVTQSLLATDCTSPDRPGAARRLYTFRGTRGQPVSIAMDAIGFYDSYLDLYGPDGDWIEYDDESGGNGNALISNFILPQDGVYTIDAGAYGSGSLGAFTLSLDGSNGSVGGIAGRVDYAGSQGGAVVVGLFDSPSFTTATTVGRQVLTSTRSFAFANLASGTTYYLGAFIDVNANRQPDAGEDSGVFGSTSAPAAILLAPGQTATGIEVSVLPSTASAAAAAYVTGLSTYAGTRTGPMVLEFWANSQFIGRPVTSRVVPTGVGAYDVQVAGGVPYYVRAFLDVNGDYALQSDEPRGVYAPHAQGAEQVFAPSGQTLVNIDVTLKDPGATGSGAIAGGGTAVLSSTYVVTGTTATVTILYTAAGIGVAPGGQIGFTAPPGFSFPINAGVSSVTVASAFTTFSPVVYSGQSAFVTLTGAGLASGETISFTWATVSVPCAVGPATVTVSAVSDGTAPAAPLFLGSPSLTVVNGPAIYAALDESYFSVKAGELSDLHRVVSYSRCGLRAPVDAPQTVELRTRFFNGSGFVTDPVVGLATTTVLSTAAALSLDFTAGQSSAPFYVVSASTGFKYLELYSDIGTGDTFYFGVTALPANALTSVSISTASGGLAQSSASVALAASGQPNQVFVNFTLGDPETTWHVLVSSLPFKAGESPNAIWERWGYGQPNKGEIAWDARFSPWVNGGARVPNGLYYARVEVGGSGGIKDDTLRVTVALPQFTGRAFDPGTVPNPPLAGVQLRVYGPAGFYTAATGSGGDYVIPGLGAGNYRVNLARPDYVDGVVDMTLNALGQATSFIPRTNGVLVSSNATGGLDLFVSRAPRLVVVPSLDASVAAAAADQWGSLQVRSSTGVATQQTTIYGPMRLQGGTTTFDDGGQWDSSTQQFIARTLLGFNVPVGTYTVLADLSGFSRSTASVYVGPDGARVDLPPFVTKAVVTGQVNYAPGAPPSGLSVGISAIALSTATGSASLSGGAFISAGSSYAFYSISGFDPGAYLLRANTQGLSAVTTGPVTVVGTATLSGIDFPNFGLGASISGLVTIGGGAPLGTPVYINAWAPGSFNFGSTVVYTNGGGTANYLLTGLDAGATYQLYANANLQGDYDLTVPSGGFPIKVSPTATQNFTISPASGVIAGTILLKPGASDFLNVSLTGITIASAKPDEVGHTFTQPALGLQNFSCGGAAAGNPSSSPVNGCCPGFVSSATFLLQGINTQTVDVRFLHSTTGQVSRIRISAVNGSTFTLVADLSASTYSISGSLINQITDPAFNTNAKIVANAPFIAPVGYPAGLSSTTARVTAVRQEIESFGVAISTVFDPVTSRVGFLDASGLFTIPNVPNGVWYVRTPNLRACATCAVLSPSVGRIVSVAGASVSSVTLTVANGYSVSGSITLDNGLQDSQVFNVSVYNRRQELVRSTVSYLGNASAGQTAGSVDYSFANLPAGEFYTLVVRGLQFPVKYVGPPVKFPDPALSPSGLQSSLVHQDVLLQRAAYLTGRLKDGGTGELIGKANASLLAPNFAITATANPWTEGGFVTAASSVANRPIEDDGYFRVGPLLPGVSYDLRLAQTSWDPNFLSNGSQNYAPVTIGGLKPTPGEIRDLGIIALGQGQSITGTVKSTTTGLGLGNIKVVAKPSFGDDLVAATFTNQQGAYSVWVSSVVSNQFTVTAAPRDGSLASDGKYYGQFTLLNVNLQTQTSANFLLTPLTVVVTGQVVVADAATGGALSYPFGDKRGFPAAAINLQPLGVVSSNPLGDIEATTDERGFFTVPGLSTGLYSLHATSLGYAVYNATVQVAGSAFHVFTGSNTPTNDLPGGVATLTRGATATGRILKSDGSAPNTSEVVGVAAANFGSGEFVVGSVEADPVAKTVNAYTVSGFKPGVSYNIVLLSGSRGKEVSFPPEGAGVVFTAAESSTTKTINLTYRPAALDCLGTAKALDAGRTQFAVSIECLKPLRQQSAADDDLTALLTASTFTALGTPVTAPNGTGLFAQRAFSSDRRRLTALYTLAPSETRFTMRVRAFASEIDPRTGLNFQIDKVFDFYAGLDAHSDGRASNIDGGGVTMQPSAQDELLGLDERSGISIPPGAFGEGSDSLADSSVVAQPTTTVNVSMTKGRDQVLAKALNIAARGYAPAALEVADVPSAFPNEMWAAMSKYRTQASTTQVGGANPLSAFYSIFLPAGIRHQLKQRADLTLSYSLAASTSTTDDKVQMWFYNAVLGRFVLENTNRRLDSVNKTITVSVDHFSTFVVLDSTPVATSSVTFGGTDIAAANFPNPADCITHSNIARNGVLFGGGVHAPFSGTMIRYSIPPGGAAPLKINIYNVAGEKVRTIDQGDLPAGQTYYTPWDCSNDNGKTVSSGVYIGEVIHGGRRKFFKIAIIKGSGL